MRRRWSQVTMKDFLVLVVTAMLVSSLGAVSANSQEPAGVSGKWKGTRAMSGDPGPMGAKIQSISFDLNQKGQTITGSYRCYPGKKANADCPSPTGEITTGTIGDDGIKLEVQTLPNNVNCTYSGKVNAAKISGNFTCHAAGSLSSVGNWNVHRY